MNIINEKVTAYINEQYRPLSPELETLRGRAESEKVPIILRDTEGLLLTLVRMKHPSQILEIGTAVGYSASCMAMAFPQCRVTTIEADQKTAEIAQENVENLGLADRITLLQGKGQEVLDTLKGPFDLVFIDAAKSHYRVFWDKAIALCSPGAVIVCDNVLMKAMTVSDEYDSKGKYKTSIRRMREFLAYLTDEAQADTCILPVGDGVSISILKG